MTPSKPVSSSAPKLASSSTPKPASMTASKPPSSIPSKPASTTTAKPGPVPGGMKPPPKRAPEVDGSSGTQIPKRKLVVKLTVNSAKVAEIQSRTPSPTIPPSAIRSAPRPEALSSKKRKSDSPPVASSSSSHKKIKSETPGTAQPRNMAAPKKASTPRRSPAPFSQPAPVAASAAPPIISSSPASSSANGIKPPRQRLPDAAPKVTTATASTPNPAPPKKQIIKLKFNTKPKLPTPSSDNSPKPASQ